MIAGVGYQEEWVKILSKGLITIPKTFRDQLGIKEGEVVRIKKVGSRLIMEPKYMIDDELYSDKELKEMLDEDKFSGNLAKEAADIWSDLQ